jgi:YidC/Oxa1 family membrane protein insertase
VGIAIILLTILIRVLLYPLNLKNLKSQQALAEISGELNEIKKKYKHDKEALVKETAALYKKANVNPFSGLVVLVIQTPILIALYQVFMGFASGTGNNTLYSFIPRPDGINPFFLGVDLSQAVWWTALLAAALLFVQTKIMTVQPKSKSAKSEFAETLQKQMNYVFPFFIFLVLIKVPSAISLYIITSGIISIIETKYVRKTRTGKN